MAQISEEEIVRAAAAIDDHSAHPLAAAVVAYAKDKKIDFKAPKIIKRRADEVLKP